MWCLFLLCVVVWCVVCVCCYSLVLGFVCPYSSVVEHPLSKRKVGSSILLGGISLCSTHRVRLVFNTKRLALFWPPWSLHTDNTQHTTHNTRKPILEYYRQVQTTTMIRVSSRNIRIHSKNKLARHFLFLAYYHKLRRPMPPTQPHQNNNTTALSVSPCQIRRLLTIYTARQSSHFLTRFVESE